MACPLSKAKLFSDALCFSITRRGYAAASQRSVSAGFGKGGSMNGFVGKVEETAMIKDQSSGTSSAWAPDPLTGYYRPANCAAEIDPVELRQMLLSNRVRPH
ncbi:late embryogenesis abundant protein Lea5-D [Ziziphus jujuba]|uniref:Late embryogenesis abundant protein Lea5-D n=1 Tax=Ziziphus jujuba TaxID=326968 RepID=A0A6P4ANU2_ZIZJJ|nr:late embryogenesis abundant protein Lea5-D [Ziziphus jujuba]